MHIKPLYFPITFNVTNEEKKNEENNLKPFLCSAIFISSAHTKCKLCMQYANVYNIFTLHSLEWHIILFGCPFGTFV